MSEILNAIKKSTIRFIEREKSEREHIIESIATIIFFTVVLGGLVLMAVSPVEISGDFDLSGNFEVSSDPFFGNKNNSNSTVTDVKFSGKFVVPAYQVIPLLRALDD